MLLFWSFSTSQICNIELSKLCIETERMCVVCSSLGGATSAPRQEGKQLHKAVLNIAIWTLFSMSYPLTIHTCSLTFTSLYRCAQLHENHYWLFKSLNIDIFDVLCWDLYLHLHSYLSNILAKGFDSVICNKSTRWRHFARWHIVDSTTVTTVGL